MNERYDRRNKKDVWRISLVFIVILSSNFLSIGITSYYYELSESDILQNEYCCGNNTIQISYIYDNITYVNSELQNLSNYVDTLNETINDLNATQFIEDIYLELSIMNSTLISINETIQELNQIVVELNQTIYDINSTITSILAEIDDIQDTLDSLDLETDAIFSYYSSISKNTWYQASSDLFICFYVTISSSGSGAYIRGLVGPSTSSYIAVANAEAHYYVSGHTYIRQQSISFIVPKGYYYYCQAINNWGTNAFFARKSTLNVDLTP